MTKALDKPEPIRQRYLADRLMMLLLYAPASEADGRDRLEDGSISLKMTKVARSLRMNSSKLFDQLLFLQHSGYITELDVRFKYGCVRLRPTKPLCFWDKP